MIGYVADPLSSEMVLTLRDELAKFHIDQNFSTWVFLSLKSSWLTPESKYCFLGLVAEILENEIELLDVQIKSHEFRDPKKFLETLPPSKQETTRLLVDFCIDSL